MKNYQAHCHKMIAETAQSMAHELYDALMKKNGWYAVWKLTHSNMGPKALEAAFVKKTWPKLLGQARATLAGMLTGPLDEGLKEQILDALIKDNSLQVGRGLGNQLSFH